MAAAVATKDEVTGIMVVVFNVVGVAEEVATTTEAEADATHKGADTVGTNWEPLFKQFHLPGNVEPLEPSREGNDDGRKSII
jgi:hypothetical protein